MRLGQLCASNPLLFVSTTGTIDDFDDKSHSQFYAASQSKPPAPHPRHPLQRESYTGAEADRAMVWVRIARRSPNVGKVHHKKYFNWWRPRTTRQRFTYSTASSMDSASGLLEPHPMTRAVASATVHTRINMQFLRPIRT